MTLGSRPSRRHTRFTVTKCRPETRGHLETSPQLPRKTSAAWPLATDHVAPGVVMIILGIVLLIVGFLAKIAVVWTIGIVILVIGAILFLLGAVGREVGGRRHYY
jgi:uncharacterized protein DUF6131